MEKTLQRQLLEMLQTLEEGIRYIGQKGNPAMLRECITAIRAIRETCQQSLPVRRQAVYVDLFDGMAQAMQQLPDQADQATLKQTADLCRELIEYARQALQKELTRKKIMVFLPYKASMWDSLESVWKAAYEDKEHCETYVIPIPYCDRNPDMTAKEWHCEAGLFPDYVPVLDWREYSRDKLREMHPDVIFIHNPYDNFNAVTSVDMQYYSRNLKGIADKLVYIPYFVMGDTIPPHFCQTQGVINADYVIVQDENIKEQYERYYPGGNPPEGKILALGSPKFDKVCNTTKDDYTLPEEWQRLIGNKKVILYNTSLTAMLEHTDKFNAKLRYVFDIFKQRDDVVLWWRPHPLLRATIDSMTPEIRDEYRQIEQQYIDEGWGIYDDTPDMDRAIVCTNAYYGDPSSLVWLYRRTKKPIVFENFKLNDPYYMPLAPTHILFNNNSMFWIPKTLNVLAEFKIDTRKIVWHDIFSENRCAIQDYFSGVNVLNDEELMLAPFFGRYFLKYNINQGRKEFIPCEDIDLSGISYKFKEGIEYGNKIFYCGYSSFVIIVYDKSRGTFEKIDDRNIMKSDSALEDYWDHFRLTQVSKFIYLIEVGTPYITVFDMETEKIYISNINDEFAVDSNMKLKKVCSNKKKVFFVTDDYSVAILDVKEREFKLVKIPEQFLDVNEWPEIAANDERLMFVEVRRKSDKEYVLMTYFMYSKTFVFGGEHCFSNHIGMHGVEKYCDNRCLIFTVKNSLDCICVYDFLTDKIVDEIDIELDTLPEIIFAPDKEKSAMIVEKSYINERLLDYLNMQHDEEKNIVNINKMICGRRIYRFIYERMV